MAKRRVSSNIYLSSVAILVSIVAVFFMIVLDSSEPDSDPVAPGPPGYLYEMDRLEVA